MNSDNRLWIVVTAIGSIAVVALGWFLGVSPQLSESAAASAQRVQVDVLNKGYSAQLEQLRADFEHVDQVKAELAQAQSQLPPNAAYPEFISELNSIASDHSVIVTNLAVTSTSVLTAPGAVPPADPDPTQTGVPNGSTVAIATSITLTGAYEDLQDAASELQKGTRLFLVSGLDFLKDVGDEEETPSYSLQIDGLLFVLTDGTTLVIDTAAPAPTETPAP